MTTFHYKARKNMAITTGTVDAPTREDAIAMIVGTAAPGEEIDVMQVQESGPVGGGATGITGASGVSGASGAAFGHSGPAGGKAKATRAQLNEMTKEELISEAEAEGVDVNHSWTKADIVEAILHHK